MGYQVMAMVSVRTLGWRHRHV